LKLTTLRQATFDWGRQTYLMGVLNVTPDSFSDGGQFDTVERAIAQAITMVESGAHLLDIGGQSARPGAVEIAPEEELWRVIPVIQALRQTAATAQIPISVDTTRAAVARQAIAAGADLINDISGGLYDADLLPTVADLSVPIVLMHLRGTPQTMQQQTNYDDVVREIGEKLAERVTVAIAAGITPDRIWLDPGIGFAKTGAQNLEILRRLPELRSLGFPLLVGTSRKSFIGNLLNQPDPKARVWGTAASCAAAIAFGADMLRVHDVAEMRDVAIVADAIWR
jgi:dihydropteroate synthase